MPETIRQPVPISHSPDWISRHLEERQCETFVIGTNAKAETIFRATRTGFSREEIRVIYAPITDDDISACISWRLARFGEGL
jgi:uncharacterized protein (DUF433 family)